MGVIFTGLFQASPDSRIMAGAWGIKSTVSERLSLAGFGRTIPGVGVAGIWVLAV